MNSPISLRSAAMLGLLCVTLAQYANAQSKPTRSPFPTTNKTAPTPPGLPTTYSYGLANGYGLGQTQTVRFESRGQKIFVSIKGSTVTAKIDGAAVPSSRIRRAGQTVKVTSEEGDVIATVSFSSPWTAHAPHLNWSLKHRAAMGLSVVSVPPAVAAHVDVDPKATVLVKRITENKAADQAGLKVHDIIVSLNGETPVTAASLRKFLAAKKPNEKIRVEYLRGGKKRSTVVELDSQPHYNFAPNKFPVDLTVPLAPNVQPWDIAPQWGTAFQRGNNQLLVTPPKAPLMQAYWDRTPPTPPNSARTGYLKVTTPKQLSVRAEVARVQAQLQQLLDRLDQSRAKAPEAIENADPTTRKAKKRDY